jgi:hypothetical protein
MPGNNKQSKHNSNNTIKMFIVSQSFIHLPKSMQLDAIYTFLDLCNSMCMHMPMFGKRENHTIWRLTKTYISKKRGCMPPNSYLQNYV